MKRIFTILSVAAGMAGAMTGCKPDDAVSKDETAPVIELTQNDVHWVPGREVTIEATVTDETGLDHILISNADMGLDETIRFGDGVITDFALSYPFTVPETLPANGSYDIVISAFDLAGNEASEIFRLYTDGDIDAPEFVRVPQSTVNLIATPDLAYTLEFEMSDNKALASLQIVCTELGLDETETLEGTSDTFSKTLNLGAEEKTYNFVFTLTDAAGLVTTAETSLIVETSPDFGNMFLTNVFTDAELTRDLYGVPVVMDKKGPRQYSIRFYNRTENEEYLFIPDDTTLEPHVYGLSEDGKSMVYGSEKKLALEKKGYYDISLNIATGEYSVTEYTPAEQEVPQIYATGENLGNNFGSWDVTNPDAILQADADNKYLLSITLNFTDSENSQFKLASANWGQEWIMNASEVGPTVKWIPKTGTDDNNCWPHVTGDWLFEFDYITGLSSLTPAE